MNNLIKESVLNTLKVVIPTEQVQEARESKKTQMKALNFSEKLNYKLHDKTTWASVGLIIYFAYTKDFLSAINELAQLIGA